MLRVLLVVFLLAPNFAQAVDVVNLDDSEHTLIVERLGDTEYHVLNYGDHFSTRDPTAYIGLFGESLRRTQPDEEYMIKDGMLHLQHRGIRHNH